MGRTEEIGKYASRRWIERPSPVHWGDVPIGAPARRHSRPRQANPILDPMSGPRAKELSTRLHKSRVARRYKVEHRNHPSMNAFTTLILCALASSASSLVAHDVPPNEGRQGPPMTHDRVHHPMQPGPRRDGPGEIRPEGPDRRERWGDRRGPGKMQFMPRGMNRPPGDFQKGDRQAGPSHGPRQPQFGRFPMERGWGFGRPEPTGRGQYSQNMPPKPPIGFAQRPQPPMPRGEFAGPGPQRPAGRFMQPGRESYERGPRPPFDGPRSPDFRDEFRDHASPRPEGRGPQPPAQGHGDDRRTRPNPGDRWNGPAVPL
jgi:hypothetical protein